MKWVWSDKDRLADFWFIAVFTWVGCYLMVQGFGLYSDDWFYFVGDRASFLASMVLDWKTAQGRPLGEALRFVLYKAAGPDDHLLNHYLVLYVLTVAQAMLAYLLLRRKTSRLAALVVVVLWLVSPTDTTRTWLTVGTMKLGLIVVFSAMLLYAKGHRISAYIVAAPTLLIYESGFFPFVLAPVFAHSLLDRNQWRGFAGHVLICAMVFGAVVALRFVLMDGQIARDNLVRESYLAPFLHGFWLYGVHWFALFAQGVWKGLRNLDLLAIAISSGAMLYLWPVSRKAAGESSMNNARGAMEWLALALLLFLSGLVFSGLNEQYPAVPWGTRATRVYYLAALGGSALLVSLAGAAASTPVMRSKLAQRVLASISIVVVAGVISNSLLIQRDYVRVWSKQRNVLVSIYQQLQDVQPDDVVLFLPTAPGGFGGERGEFIAFYPWGQWMDNLDRVFRWQFRKRRVSGPRMALMYSEDRQAVDLLKNLTIGDGGELELPGDAVVLNRAWRDKPALIPGKLIFFIETPTGAARIDAPITADGRVVNRLYQGFNPAIYLNRKLQDPYNDRIYPENRIFLNARTE